MVPAQPAGASVWTLLPNDKAFPDTRPGGNSAIVIEAAGGEYEGAQIAVRGVGTRAVSITWATSSDPLLVANSTLYRIGYVRVRRASTGTGARPGLYPDPLLPMRFGQQVNAPGGTTAFYVLAHVPRDTPAGDLHGELIVREGATQTPVPVTLHVYGFTLSDERVATFFPFDVAQIQNSLRGKVKVGQPGFRRVLSGYYRVWMEHGLSPGMLSPLPSYDWWTGHMVDEGLDSFWRPWLDASAQGPGFAATRLQWNFDRPYKTSNMAANRQKIKNYLVDLCRFYKKNGWADKVYTYLVDEPNPGAEERRAQMLAELVHESSAAAGYRIRYLLTAEPRARAMYGKPANSFLFNDVDIWATRIFRFWDYLSALRAQHRDGKEIWLYTYAFNNLTRLAPTFLIDESLADEHAIFWMMWRWDATGQVYWQTTRWCNAWTGAGRRDPYKDPLSFAGHGMVFNGEASLVYPGYEPELGLNDPYAPPVASMRLEALRDGVEEYAYLQAASDPDLPQTYAAAARDCAQRIAAMITDYPSGPWRGQWRNIPAFARSPALYQAARRRLAAVIERANANLPPVSVSGRVTAASGGQPIAGATVSDGVLRATTGSDGSYQLVGVLPSHKLTVSHPLYQAVALSGHEGDAPADVVLSSKRGVRLLAGFESGARMGVTRGSVTATGVAATSGHHAASVKLSGLGATATLAVPSGGRNLRAYRSIAVDLYNPSSMNWHSPWTLRISAFDSAGHECRVRVLLKPKAWTHVRLPIVSAGFNRSAVSSIKFLLYASGTHAFYLDTVIAQ